ncbi:MAG: response regulator [Candidatus Acidiferrales bacterium]
MSAHPILELFLADQGYALFENVDGSAFRPIGEYPKWCEKMWKGAMGRDKTIRLGEASPFLDNFLIDAEGFWNSNRAGPLNSQVWIERDSAGQETPLEAAALHLDGKNVLLLRNLSNMYAERQKLYQAARDSLLEHEKLIREIQKKEILLHCIIHDLSQPLTAMRGCFSLMALEDLSAELRRMVDTGQRESQRQEQMIRGILQAFSADLAGQQVSAEKDSAAAGIADCAKHAVEEFSPAFREKEIRLQLDPAVDLARDWTVAADDARLDRIFGNLLENALRYSPNGTAVTIGLEDKGNSILAFVDDQGPGLPKDQPAGQMFALFAKGKDKPGKAGLGLYFCKITVERWGGTIGAETKAKGGTRFWFRLPRAAKSVQTGAKKESARAQGASAAAAKNPTTPNRPRMEKPAKRLRVLIAEDTDENRELVSELLKKRGHSVAGVANGREALDALEKDSYDVVLMDEQMPVMDGLEATRAIRQKEQSSGKHQVIVALTGNVAEEDKQQRIEAGMDGFVPKPFEMQALFETIEFLGNFGNQVIPASPAAARQPAPERATRANASQVEPAAPAENVTTHLRRMTGGNAKLIQKLAKSFLADAPKRLAGIRSAIAAKNPAKLDAAAHLLKGSIGIFGEHNAFDAARNLETMGRGRNLSGADAEFRALEAAVSQLRADLLAMNSRKKPRAKASRKRRKK